MGGGARRPEKGARDGRRGQEVERGVGDEKRGKEVYGMGTRGMDGYIQADSDVLFPTGLILFGVSV